MVVGIAFLGVAILILTISIFRSAAVHYSFKLSSGEPVMKETEGIVDYSLPYPGKVTPESLLWPLKVVRDKAWVLANSDPLRKADVLLLLSDKRLLMGKGIVEKGKMDLGVSVLVKSGMYLDDSLKMVEMAQRKGMSTSEFLGRFSLASLKHREVLEIIYNLVPEDGRPVVSKLIGKTNSAYEKSSQLLHEIGREPAKNPFE